MFLAKILFQEIRFFEKIGFLHIVKNGILAAYKQPVALR